MSPAFFDTENAFKNKLLRQNDLETFSSESDVKVLRVYVPKKQKNQTTNVIIEVNAELFKQIMCKAHVFIGWSSCKVYEHLDVTRCYKCCKYGHVAKYCKSEREVCPLCAGDHQMKECTVENRKCVNCQYAKEVLRIANLNTDHAVFDRSCPAYVRALKTAKNRVEYGEP